MILAMLYSDVMLSVIAAVILGHSAVIFRLGSKVAVIETRLNGNIPSKCGDHETRITVLEADKSHLT